MTWKDHPMKASFNLDLLEQKAAVFVCQCACFLLHYSHACICWSMHVSIPQKDNSKGVKILRVQMGMWYWDGKKQSCYKRASEPVSLFWVHVNAVDLQDRQCLKVLNTTIGAALFGERADLHTDMKQLQAEEHSFQAFCSFTLRSKAAEWHFKLILYISTTIMYSRLVMVHLVND